MNHFIQNIKTRYQTGNWVEKIILIHIGIFILGYLLNFLSPLFHLHNILFEGFGLPSNLNLFVKKPWTLLSYGGLHDGWFHILFNMINLYYFGNLFLDYFLPKKFIPFYFMGIISGGLIFLIVHVLFPSYFDQQSTLVGASAGVYAIMIGMATFLPNYQIKIRFIGYVKLIHIALIILAWDVISLFGPNTGGHIAHLGGACYGFLSMYYKDSLKLTNPFKNLFQKKSPLKKSYQAQDFQSNHSNSKDVQAEIDKILDKISQSGYEALTKKEKEFLFKQRK